MLKRGLDLIKSFQKPSDLLQVYKAAFESLDEKADPDSRIKAYDTVVNYCGESETCQIDNSIKRNMVLYWTYNNLGDAWLQRGVKLKGMVDDISNYRNAISYYREAVNVAVDGEEKTNSLQKMAEIYRQIEDIDGLRKAEEEVVESLGDEYKRMAYLKLADVWKGTNHSTKWVEKALDFVNKEDVSLLEKCKNTLLICETLLNVYKETEDKENIKRINRLLNKTAVIAIRDLEDKIAEATQRRDQLELYAQMLELVNVYCKEDNGFKMKAVQKIVNSLEDGEVLSLEKFLL